LEWIVSNKYKMVFRGILILLYLKSLKLFIYKCSLSFNGKKLNDRFSKTGIWLTIIWLTPYRRQIILYEKLK